MLEYFYTEETKEYTHAEEVFTDPLESQQQGTTVYMFSANATTQEPLERKEGYAIVFNGDAWEYIEDHRGQIVWKSYDESMEIRELGAIPEGWTTEQPEKPATLEDLSQFLYQQKCKIAYGGVTVIKDGFSYIFETNQDSITMCNSMALALSTQPDTTQITWKTWKDNTPVMLIVSKAEFNAIFSFGMLMINTAFGIEGVLNEQVQKMTEEQLADFQFVQAFKTEAVTQFAQVNTVFDLKTVQ